MDDRMDPNPPKPSYQLALLLLISLEIVAVIWGNDALLIGVFVLVVIVAFIWIRYSRSHSLRAKYLQVTRLRRRTGGGKLTRIIILSRLVLRFTALHNSVPSFNRPAYA